MACLPLTITTATSIRGRTFSSSSTFSLKSSQVPIATIPKHRHAVSCKTLDDDRHQENSGKVDRRNVVLGLGGIYGATTTFGSNLSAFADPIVTPTECDNKKNPYRCCPPTPTSSKKIIDFSFPPPPSTNFRVRPAAHLVNKDYIAKYSKAIEMMKNLPHDDPRSFMQQANVHCAYCDANYSQDGHPDRQIQVHKSWLFFPFHRLFLFFFERICGNLIGDPNFAIPFWNWDSPHGMKIPDIYTNKNSPLYDEYRDKKHRPPSLIDLQFDSTDYNRSPMEQILMNLCTVYKQMGANSASLFMGSPYRAGDEPSPGADSLELLPHNTVHDWTGDRNKTCDEHMGVLYAAARDPIFYAHHANIDRLWSVWKTLGGRKKDFTDKDWLDSSFLFYNENADLVRIKVRDCLDTKKLGYCYQDVDELWKNCKPKPIRASVTLPDSRIPFARDVFPASLDTLIKVRVPRPKKSRTRVQKEKEEEILVIEGIEVESDAFVKFDVLVNYEGDGMRATADMTEFVGSFVDLHHEHMPGKKAKTRLRLGINEALENLGAEDHDYVSVTLVPRTKPGEVSIKGIEIEYED